MKKIYVMLPCFNEEYNIGALIDNWMKQRSRLQHMDYDIQVRAIDDASTDNTNRIIVDKIGEYPENVGIIVHKFNKNLYGGLNTSINYFLQNANEEDLMCLMDGDNTHDPSYAYEMVNKLIHDQNTECVIASRYCSNSSVLGLTTFRKSMSVFARVYYTIILHVPGVKDYTCGYRVYRHSAINRLVKRFGKDPIHEKSFACMMELLYKLYLTGTRFAEVGFELRYDKKLGESKMNVGLTARKSINAALKLRALKKNL